MSRSLRKTFNIADHFIDRAARMYPDRIAILGEPAEIRYRELSERVNRAGNALIALGCEPGDRVLIVLPDSIEFVAAFFGTAKIGAIAVPVNPFTRRDDFAYYMADSDAKVAIVHEVAWAEFCLTMENVPLRRVAIVGKEDLAIDCSGQWVSNWQKLLSQCGDTLQPHPTRPEDDAFLLYTSGSGGTPKAAIHRHEDMLHTTAGFAHSVLGIKSEDRCFSVSKLFFAYGLGNGMYFPLSVGAASILNPDRPRPDRVAALIAKHRPTIFFSVPTFYAGLLQEAERGLNLDFASVRIAVSAGEPLPAELFARYRERFGVEILDGIGSTEMLHMFIASRPGHGKPSSCGREVPGYEASILDDEGVPVSRGEIGNLWVRGPSAFTGYWKKPGLTVRTRKDGWIVTGDKFSQDDEGYYNYRGRTDDLFKVAGMWVSPGEVENALLAHPAVAEAAVVARRGDTGLFHGVAFVVLLDGGSGGQKLATEIQSFVQARLPTYKVPQKIYFQKELPKTATGKIQRYRLREDAMGRIGSS